MYTFNDILIVCYEHSSTLIEHGFRLNSTFSYINQPFKPEDSLNWTLCLVLRGSDLEGFHCI